MKPGRTESETAQVGPLEGRKGALPHLEEKAENKTGVRLRESPEDPSPAQSIHPENLLPAPSRPPSRLPACFPKEQAQLAVGAEAASFGVGMGGGGQRKPYLFLPTGRGSKVSPPPGADCLGSLSLSSCL